MSSAIRLREAHRKQEMGQASIILCIVEHGDLAEPIRVAKNTVDVVHQGQTFKGNTDFDVKFPDDRKEELARLQLVLGDVEGKRVDALRSISGPCKVTIFSVLSDDLNEIWGGPFYMLMRGASKQGSVIVGTLALEDDILAKPASESVYNPFLFPGAFK